MKKFLVIFILLSSCNKDNIIRTNISSNYETFSSFFFYDDNKVVLVGSNDNMKDFTLNESVFYKSSLNDLKNWKLSKIKCKGRNYFASFNKNNIYLANSVYTLKKSEKNINNLIYKLSLKDNNCSKVYDFKDKYIKYCNFTDEQKAIAIVRNSNEAKGYYLYRTEDDFVNRDSFLLDIPVIKALTTHRNLYVLSYKKNNSNDIIYRIDNNNSIDTLNLKFNIFDFFVESDNNIWLLGKNNNNIELRKTKDDTTVLINTFKIEKKATPEKIHQYNDFIAVLISSSESYSKFPIQGSNYNLFLSFDRGKSFKEITITIDNYLKPISFYKDEKILIYSGAGKISLIDLKHI